MTRNEYEEFKTLIEAEFNFWKPKGRKFDAQLISDYWTALVDMPLDKVKAAALQWRRTGKGFPKPAEFRPKDAKGNATAPPVHTQNEDHARNFWRSLIVAECMDCLDLRFCADGHEIFRWLLLANRTTLAASIVHLLDELCEQEARSGRSDGMMLGMRRQARDIAGGYRHDVRAERERRVAINRKELTTSLDLPTSTNTSEIGSHAEA